MAGRNRAQGVDGLDSLRLTPTAIDVNLRRRRSRVMFISPLPIPLMSRLPDGGESGESRDGGGLAAHWDALSPREVWRVCLQLEGCLRLYTLLHHHAQEEEGRGRRCEERADAEGALLQASPLACGIRHFFRKGICTAMHKRREQ